MLTTTYVVQPLHLTPRYIFTDRPTSKKHLFFQPILAKKTGLLRTYKTTLKNASPQTNQQDASFFFVKKRSIVTHYYIDKQTLIAVSFHES
jgi:hypothetical protein